MRKLLCCVTIVKLQMVGDLNQALFGLAEFYSRFSVWWREGGCDNPATGNWFAVEL